MHFATMLAAPLLAAITAFTVSTQTDVAITHVHVPVVVFGTAWSELEEGRVSAFPAAKDVSAQQIAGVEAELVADGIPAGAIQTWTQDNAGTRIGILMIDLGTPAQARTGSQALTKLHDRYAGFGWNVYAGVDCSALDGRLRAQLEAQARDAAMAYTTPGSHLKVQSLKMTTDPWNGTFDPVPLCPADAHPFIARTSQRAPSSFSDGFVRYASANVAVSYTPSPGVSAVPAAYNIFPFSTFGFPEPIIGHQNRAFVLHGQFAATPGASDIRIPVRSVLVQLAYQDDARYAAAVRAVENLHMSGSDYRAIDERREIYVRLSPVTDAGWRSISSLGTTRVYPFVRDCDTLRRYARAQALQQSKNLAQAAARAIHVRLGPLVISTDWAGPSSGATCGSDGSGDLTKLIAIGKKSRGATAYDVPSSVDFEESLYAAWTLGKKPPKIVSNRIVERLVPVIQADTPGTQVSGTATLTPDAYFYTGRSTSDFTTTVVASKGEVPSGSAPGNVLTNCEAAQERAVANAVRVAQLDSPVHAFYAQPARLLSIACLPSEDIGHTYNSLPTVYNDTSPTGAPQATDTITLFEPIRD